MKTFTWTTSVRNWCVNGLFHSTLQTMSWGRTLKTSETTTIWNWNVGGLLGGQRRPPRARTGTSIVCSTGLPRHERHDSRHFHQLFSLLRLAEKRPRRARRVRNLWHCGNLLWNDRCFMPRIFSTSNWSIICGTGASRNCTRGATSESCSTVCRCTHPCGRSSTRASGRSRGGTNASPCSAPHVPPPGPLPSSGAVRCGAEAMPHEHRGVAPSSGGHCLCRRLRRRVQPSTTKAHPLGLRSRGDHLGRGSHLEQNWRLVVVVGEGGRDGMGWDGMGWVRMGGEGRGRERERWRRERG